MKFELKELVEDVKNELLCYEDMEVRAEAWEKEFFLWVEKNKGKNKDILEEKGTLYFKIKDEEEIFEIADSYMDALEEGNVKTYWEKF